MNNQEKHLHRIGFDVHNLEDRLGCSGAIDKRDEKYPMKAAIKKVKEVTKRSWRSESWWGDQGNFPHCVGFGLVHLLEDGPVHQKGKAPCIDPVEVYREAQKRDEWPGEQYDGTSVHAGIDYLKEKGFIESYYWTNDAKELVEAILSTSPVIVGTTWTRDMFYPVNGIIKATGHPLGGHCYKIDAYDKRTQLFRIKNSWGRLWGVKGFAYIHFRDIADLAGERFAECAIVKEEKK